MKSSLIINSVVSFAGAFLLLHFLNEYTTALVASFYGLKPVMYIHSIKYNAYDMWTPYNVKRTFIASGIMNLVLGIIFFRLFLSVKEKNRWYRMFFLWCCVSGFIMFLGKILSIPFYEFKPDPPGHIAFGVVAAYKYLGLSVKWMISVFGILLMVATGLFMTYQFLRNAETKDQLKRGDLRRNFIFSAVLIPYILGMFLVAATNFPDNLRTLMIYFFVGLLIIVSSLLFSSRTIKVLLHKDEPQKISYPAMGMLFTMILFYKLFYERGIGCKGFFDFLLCCNCTG
ncbi:MAG: hypothetical protein POELPBGB_03663 [Bacteroidia bacterium]|nr:hypothetical protein [Bacteroidia bacterium]